MNLTLADEAYFDKDSPEYSGYSAGNATWIEIASTMDPYMVGPALDTTRSSVYFFTRSCAEEVVLAAMAWLLDKQI